VAGKGPSAGLGGCGAAPQVAVHPAASLVLDTTASRARHVAATQDLPDIRASLAIWPTSAPGGAKRNYPRSAPMDAIPSGRIGAHRCLVRHRGCLASPLGGHDGRQRLAVLRVIDGEQPRLTHIRHRLDHGFVSAVGYPPRR
jgi:hypothetical protein